MLHNFKLAKGIMKETTRYDDIALRPYTTAYDRSIEQFLAESTEGGTNINAQALSAAANQFLRPSAVAKGQANIANGMSTNRLCFMLEVVDMNGGMAAGNRYIITGYTDHFGISNNMGRQSIDGNMRMYINNVFMLRDTQVNTPNGIQIRTNVVDNMHVLIDPNSNNPYGGGGGGIFSQRPEDVFATIGYNNDIFMAEARANGIDQRSMVTTPRASARRNDSRPSYLSETIKSFKNATAEEEAFQDDDMSEYSNVWSRSRDYQRKSGGILSGNKLMNALTTSADYMTLGYVTYSDMCRIIPNFDDQVTVMPIGAANISQEYQPGQGENWSSTTVETIAATIISQVAPSLLTDCLMTGITVVATNDTFGGQHDIMTTNYRGFTENVDLKPFALAFEQRFQREVLDDISHNNSLRYSIRCHINLLYDSSYEISIDGGPAIRYVAPSFCDSLYSPVVTTDANDITTMSSDIETMLYNVGGDLRRMVNPQSNPSPIYTGQDQAPAAGGQGFNPMAFGNTNDDSL